MSRGAGGRWVAAWLRPGALVAGWLLLAGSAAMAAEPEAVFLPYWERLPEHAGWRMLVSPGFPAAWPPVPGGVVRYAFAMRIPAGLADGAEMAAPWARSRGGTVEVLQSRLVPLGIQGVRPIGAAEIALAGREEEVAALLGAGGSGAMEARVREITCGWVKRQGVVAAAILPRHPGFAAWLGCR